MPIFYEARLTAQGLPEPSSLRGSTLGTSPVRRTSRQRLGVNRIDSCNFELLCSQGQLCNVYNYQFNGIRGWAGQLCQIRCWAVI